MSVRVVVGGVDIGRTFVRVRLSMSSCKQSESFRVSKEPRLAKNPEPPEHILQL